MTGKTHRVYVQHVDGEVVGCQVHALEDLLESEPLVARLAHLHVGLPLQGLLDEAQKVLLVHTGRAVDVGVHLEKRASLGG